MLDTLFDEKDPALGKSILRIPYHLAPIQVVVLPLVQNNPAIRAMSGAVHKLLAQHFTVEHNTSGGIGARYLKSGIKGVPYCVTIDYDSLEHNDVTVRDRDTEVQTRVAQDRLVLYMRTLL